MLVGTSGVFLIEISRFFTHRDYSHELLHLAPQVGQVAGAVAGLWFARSILKGVHE
jgi:hypothetical protein